MYSWEEFKEFYPPKNWLVREPAWVAAQQKTRETQFTLGNGDFCCRGVLEEIPYDSTPGTYIDGLFDRTGAQITELVNCPNPINLRIDTYGEKLDMIAMDVLKHERVLDMRNGVLNRQTIFRTAHKKRVLYQSRRFISMHDKHLGVMEIHVTPLDAAMTFNIQTTIDTSVSNKGVLTEGRKIHYQPHEVSTTKDISYLCVRTFENQTLLAYASSLEICRKERCRMVAERALKLRVRKDETITFRKFFTLYTSRTVKPHQIKKQTIGALKRAHKAGLKRIYEEHARAWEKKWKNANVEIEGDLPADQALRFNIYHLIIAGNEENDNVSVGARTLSGEGYRGHVFWDAELFIMPFFIYSFPWIARNQLMYRYRRLGAAKANAAAKGYKGALFPWESADTGEECTPSWAKGYDGTIIRITTLNYEHHIVADIAYAVEHYVRATRDLQFLWKYGLELMMETARFWHSRVKLNKKRKRYEIHDAMGPDEFHEKVDNSAFTNILAQWNLQTACRWYRLAKSKYPKKLAKITRRLKLGEKEVKGWYRVASKIYMPYNRKKNLIEQFEGYFKLRDPRITRLDDHFMPLLPSGVDYRNIDETQLLKQADVVMLFFLLSDRFSLQEKKKNYYYYEKRTMHKSSLSPAIHSIVGLEVGDDDKALHYFAHAASTDLSDIHGNSNEGMHGASSGGTWQSLMLGFAGMRVRENEISFTPRLPPDWKALRFAVWYHGAQLRVCLTHCSTNILIEHAPPQGKIFANVYGIRKQLAIHRFVTFKVPNAMKKKKRKCLSG
ncbi:MAG: glycosyl hydrolase family 65 protein [Pseudomonadota bacterium]